MSSFVVTNATINAIVHLLDLDLCGCPGHKLGVKRDTPEGPRDQGDVIGRQLLVLNLRATNARYGQTEQTMAYEQFRWQPKNYKHVVLIKAADCWLYQCAEGDEFTNSDIYREVRGKRDRLCRHIVSNLPEYDSAPWDLEEVRACCGPVVEAVL